MGKKIWLSMHRRNFGSHVTVRAPSAPQHNQFEMTFFNLSGGFNLYCFNNLMTDVYLTVILATRTFREEKTQQESRVYFSTKF